MKSNKTLQDRIRFAQHDRVQCYLEYVLREVKKPNVRGIATVMAEQCQDTKGQIQMSVGVSTGGILALDRFKVN